MGIMWQVGNGKKARFWKGHWLGNTSLAIPFWPLYVINEQQGKTVAQVWDGENQKLSFRRSVSKKLMEMWFDLLSIVEEVHLVEEAD